MLGVQRDRPRDGASRKERNMKPNERQALVTIRVGEDPRNCDPRCLYRMYWSDRCTLGSAELARKLHTRKDGHTRRHPACVRAEKAAGTVRR